MPIPLSLDAALAAHRAEPAAHYAARTCPHCDTPLITPDELAAGRCQWTPMSAEVVVPLLLNSCRGDAHTPTKRDLHPALTAADEAWSAEGQRLFGKRWGDVRYTAAARGELGTELHKLHEVYSRLTDAWHAAPSADYMLYSDPSLPAGAPGKHVHPEPHWSR